MWNGATSRVAIALASIAIATRGASSDPHRFALVPVGQVRGISGAVALVPAWSPFGIAVTPDGRTTYDLTISVKPMPQPSSFGEYRDYIAWLATPDLEQVRNLGTISADRPIATQTDWNKFVVFVSAERTPRTAKWSGPLLLVGRSPSALMQSFLGHPFYNTGTPP